MAANKNFITGEFEAFGKLVSVRPDIKDPHGKRRVKEL